MKDKNGNKGSIREKVNTVPYSGQKIKHSFIEVHDFFRKVLRVSPSMYFDGNDENFSLDEDGSEYYLDMIGNIRPRRRLYPKGPSRA